MSIFDKFVEKFGPEYGLEDIDEIRVAMSESPRIKEALGLVNAQKLYLEQCRIYVNQEGAQYSKLKDDYDKYLYRINADKDRELTRAEITVLAELFYDVLAKYYQEPQLSDYYNKRHKCRVYSYCINPLPLPEKLPPTDRPY